MKCHIIQHLVMVCTVLHEKSSTFKNFYQWKHSAVKKVSGNRCKSDCRSRGREFDPARSHTFFEIDHEIISTVILLPSAESFKKGCCQLQVKVCTWSTSYLLVQACPGKSVVRWTDSPAMTIAVDLGCKATKQTYKPMWALNMKNVQFHTYSQVRIQRGDRGSGPPLEITSYMGLYRN